MSTVSKKLIKRELPFISLVSIVIGSQLGSGTFIFPSLLAPYGTIGFLGWIIAIGGAISIALVFAELSSKLPKDGGPHVYVTEAFGRKAGFFMAWVYWIISWSSNSILFVTAVSYLCAITGKMSSVQVLAIEIFILAVITYVNILGVRISGIVEVCLTSLKVVPLFFLPLLFFFHFDPSHFEIPTFSECFSADSISTILKATILMSWGFVGIESATAPAGSVKNPQKTLPKAIVMGTSCVAIIYILNMISVIGVTGFEPLLNSKAPYAVAIKSLYSGDIEILMSILAIVVCVGTLNAWTLTSSRIAAGAASDKLFPEIFGRLNKRGAPVYALLMAAIGLLPFFIGEQIVGIDGLNYLIDLICGVFLFVYMFSIISYIKMLKKWKKTAAHRIRAYILSFFALGFCIFVIIHSVFKLIIATIAVFIITGIPVYLYNKKR